MERRVFKETLMTYYKLLYVVIAVCCVFSMWNKHIIVAVPLVIILLLITDRLVKGEYIVDSESVILRRGRFMKERALLINSIRSVKRHKGINAARGNIELVFDGYRVFLNPENPDSFIDALLKRNASISVS